APGIVLGELLRNDRRRKLREALSRRCFLSGNGARRDRAFFNREQRLACFAVKPEDMPDLCSDGHGWDIAAVALHCDEHRLRSYVVVPQVVMNHLKVPNYPSGRSAQRNYRVCVFVVTFTLAAVEVRAWAASRNEDQAALGINRDDRPGVGGAGSSCALC